MKLSFVCDRIDDAEVEVVWSKPVDKQTYNTRKALTKVFTAAGSGLMTGQDMVRRRGAAGIRGLGAPGTTPPKQLVARYASVSPSSGGAVPPTLSPLPRHMTYKTAVEQLQDIALANGWGEPVYTPVMSEQSEGGQERFCYKV